MPQPTLSAQLRPTAGPLAFLLSSVGLKAVMAISGLALTGFLVAHMLGHMLLFVGRDAYNDYAATLHSMGGVLWAARLGLLTMAGAHVLAASKLTTENALARTGRYAVDGSQASSYAGRTMRWSGPIVLLFIIYHLAHFTFGVTPGDFPHSATDVYGNVVRGFSVPLVAYFYAFAHVLLGMHLFHGLWSMFQTLGVNHPSYNFHLRALAVTLTLLIAGSGFFIPLAVLSGTIVL